MKMKMKTRRNIRKRKTQKRIKGAGLYESAPDGLYKMIKQFITKHSKDIKSQKDMRQAVADYKAQMASIDDRDYLAVRNYIWSSNPDTIPLFLDLKHRQPSSGTPTSVCDEIADYFYAVKKEAEQHSEWVKWLEDIDAKLPTNKISR